MVCLYTLLLARPAQAKIQMLTAIYSIVKLIHWNLVNLSHISLYKNYLAKVVLDLQKLGLIPKFYFEMFSLELSKKWKNFQLVNIIGSRNQKLILMLLTNRSLKKPAQVELLTCLGNDWQLLVSHKNEGLESYFSWF